MMCLGAIGEVKRVWRENGLEMGLVSIEGRESTVCLACTPEAGQGSVVLVHSGFAVEVLAVADSARLNELWLEAAAHASDEE